MTNNLFNNNYSEAEPFLNNLDKIIKEYNAFIQDYQKIVKIDKPIDKYLIDIFRNVCEEKECMIINLMGRIISEYHDHQDIPILYYSIPLENTELFQEKLTHIFKLFYFNSKRANPDIRSKHDNKNSIVSIQYKFSRLGFEYDANRFILADDSEENKKIDTKLQKIILNIIRYSKNN